MRVSHYNDGILIVPMVHANNLIIWEERAVAIGFSLDNHVKKIVSQAKTNVNSLKPQALVTIGMSVTGLTKKRENVSPSTGVWINLII